MFSVHFRLKCFSHISVPLPQYPFVGHVSTYILRTLGFFCNHIYNIRILKSSSGKGTSIIWKTNFRLFRIQAVQFGIFIQHISLFLVPRRIWENLSWITSSVVRYNACKVNLKISNIKPINFSMFREKRKKGSCQPIRTYRDVRAYKCVVYRRKPFPCWPLFSGNSLRGIRFSAMKFRRVADRQRVRRLYIYILASRFTHSGVPFAFKWLRFWGGNSEIIKWWTFYVYELFRGYNTGKHYIMMCFLWEGLGIPLLFYRDIKLGQHTAGMNKTIWSLMARRILSSCKVGVGIWDMIMPSSHKKIRRYTHLNMYKGTWTSCSINCLSSFHSIWLESLCRTFRTILWKEIIWIGNYTGSAKRSRWTCIHRGWPNSGLKSGMKMKANDRRMGSSWRSHKNSSPDLENHKSSVMD